MVTLMCVCPRLDVIGNWEVSSAWRMDCVDMVMLIRWSFESKVGMSDVMV